MRERVARALCHARRELPDQKKYLTATAPRSLRSPL